MPSTESMPVSVSGVQLAQGVGAQPARGFWAEAWAQVLRRHAAVLALSWLGVIAFFAVFGPLVASGHPLLLRDNTSGRLSSPLLTHLRPIDLAIIAGVLLGAPWVLLARRGRAGRFGAACAGAIAMIATVTLCAVARAFIVRRDAEGFVRMLRDEPWAGPLVCAVLALGVLAVASGMRIIAPASRRWLTLGVACSIGAASAAIAWDTPLPVYDYLQREQRGEISATYTLVPWSSSQRFTELSRRAPMTSLGEALSLEPDAPGAARHFLLGTDALGQDVLAQLISGCRLSISLGLVSTGLAVLIGVTIGAIMGYFGGILDLVLFRVVEIFMAVPVLFLLVVASGVLPPEMRSTYVLMAIIGCFTWTGAARFTRAEFLRMRHQDFVQSARAVGLPLRSILFRHMLPNGVTPVLVDASFAIAGAISLEATLSFLNLGPVDQASWGKLLASATTPEGGFKPWLALAPGLTIFLTVLSYNLLGETLRDAIDPKLKKARV